MAVRDLATDFAQAATFQQAGRLLEAAALYEEILRGRPDLVDAHMNLALTLRGLGRGDDALASYERAITCDPACAEAHFGRGALLQALGQNGAAISAYDAAIRLDPRYAEAWSNRGNALQAVERNEEAIKSYDHAIAIQPNYVEAHYNRANAFHELGRWSEAVEAYDGALQLNPASAEAWSNRGSALAHLGRNDEALASYQLGIVSDPNHAGSRRNMFWHHFAEARDPELIQRLSEDAMGVKTRRMIADLQTKQTIPNFRVLHDLEQSDYLLAHGHAFEGLPEANRVLRDMSNRAREAESVEASAQETLGLAQYWANVYRVPETIEGPCLNPNNDWAAIEQTYLDGWPEIVCIDDFLSAPALEKMQAFCLTSTVWRMEYANAYLGAFADDGFISPLHMQIMTEMKARMPRVILDYPIKQLWGFKYMSESSSGIGVHADFARINLNFWITPDTANRDSSSGGMVIYDVPAPQSWNFREYNGNPKRIYEFLRSRDAGQRKIAYKCNRAVLFNSNLFHETDRFDFKDGYENHRINITYLFGRGLKAA